MEKRWMPKLSILLVALLIVFLTASAAFAAPTHKDIFTDYNVENAMNHVSVLAPGDDARETGTPGEFAAADYIANYFDSIGLEVQRQTFDITLFEDNGSTLQAVYEDQVKGIDSKTLQFSCSSDITEAKLVFAGLGSSQDFLNNDFVGKVALIQRGTYYFQEKVENAAAAGAIGVIIYNNTDGVINGTLTLSSEIPAIAITEDDGQFLKGLLDSEVSVKVNMSVDTVIDKGKSQNIIGIKRAERVQGKDPQIVVLGAHYDCVDTPGANDNASGTATLMETARLLPGQKFGYDIHFVAFGAEEIGLVGSEHYVLNLEERGQIENVAAMINMDMVGVGDTLELNLAYDDSSTWLQSLFINTAEILGLPYDTYYVDASDHANFELFSIPTTFVAYGDDPYYHTDEDSIDKIDEANMYNSGKIVASVLYQVAKTPMPKAEQGKIKQTQKLHTWVKGEKVYMQ